MASNVIPFLEGDDNSMDVDSMLTQARDVVTENREILEESDDSIDLLTRYTVSSILQTHSVDHVIPNPITSQTNTVTLDKSIQTDLEDKTCKCNLETSKKRAHCDDEDDEARLCSICFDIWSNSGEHRLCALHCGHLFGHSCLIRWLASQKTCPSCKSTVRKTDIRFIYAKKLIALDTCELDAVRMELDQEKRIKNGLRIELTQCKERENMQKKQISDLKVQIDVLKKSTRNLNASQSISNAINAKIYKEKSLEIHKDGGCRVMDYYRDSSVIVVSAPSSNPLFSAFGVRKVHVDQFKYGAFISMHTQMIRDLSFHPQRDLLLSVSLDKSARLTETANNKSVCSVQCGGPIWSCCWDTTNPNCFFIGEQMGSVSKYDMRKSNEKISVLQVPGDHSPVVSLASPAWFPDSALRQDSVLVCKLNSCWAFEGTNDNDSVRYPLSLEGPFVSMRYDNTSRHLLVSSRSNPRYGYSRHTVCSLIKDKNISDNPICSLVQTFKGSALHKLLSRSCQISLGQDVLVAAHQENTKTVDIWSVSNGARLHSLPAFLPVIDLCPIVTNDSVYLAAMNEKKLDFFKIEY
ncbi:mutagen-sensitive 302 [Carabus blaptoides fortunei]